jgi:hypothetical protein
LYLKIDVIVEKFEYLRAYPLPLHSLIFPLIFPLEIQEKGESEKYIKISKDAEAGI